MNIPSSFLEKNRLLRLREFFLAKKKPAEHLSDEPLRAEIFSVLQMQEHAETIALRHKIMEGKCPERLLKRLNENETLLQKIYNLLSKGIEENVNASPAGEWLLDNFYLIKEQITIGKKLLPKGYSVNLPKLSTGRSAYLPRVYDIASDAVSHSDGRMDIFILSRYIKSYQKQTALTLGELWAIPIMLRLALIENLRRIMLSVAIDQIDKKIAMYWEEKLTEAAESDSNELVLVIAEMIKSKINFSGAFVAEFTRRLQTKGQGLAMPLTWLDQHLASEHTSRTELINLENQRQAADQVSVRNSIKSLRLLKTSDWRKFVEEVSLVENILKKDPSGTYRGMDFDTRDNYRHVVERIARKSNLSEIEVAGIALNLAQKEFDKRGNSRRESHVGYYLTENNGLAETQRIAKMKKSFADIIRSFLHPYRFFVYASSIVILAVVLSLFAIKLAGTDKAPNILISILIGFSALIVAGNFAIQLINWIVTKIMAPEVLPKMDFSKKVPDDFKTLVAVPCMLTSPEGIEDLAESLEVRYLSNPDKNIFYALVTDFTDAPSETMPGDERLVQTARANIDYLNEKYRANGRDIFYLFHRPRLWNERENSWMGYERKRGKLFALNQFLLNGNSEPFSVIVGHASCLTDIKYVITLDADTQLPREKAHQLIGAMAHPLNRPVYDKKLKRITEGYGILQPRVAITLPKAGSSFYARLNSNDSGLDPYTRAISDVYQDLFDEGSFIGKGIYDIAAFEESLEGKFPENRILSHDLIEGCYVRSGLASDIELYEEYPGSYVEDVRRRHRWVRGDWQIIDWAFPYPPDSSGKRAAGNLSALSRWKILDNLRRSIFPAAFLVLFTAGWMLLANPLVWSLILLGTIWLPAIIKAIWTIFDKPKDKNLAAHWYETKTGFVYETIQIFFTVACLPFKAWYNLNAILKTLWRIIISKKNTLEWVPSGTVRFTQKKWPFNYYRLMIASPIIVLIILAAISAFNPGSLPVALPFLLFWLIGPAIAWQMGKPEKERQVVLSRKEKLFLHVSARKTWGFFETFVTANENWLPPDNFQVEPAKGIAHRTSPTNIGLALLANVMAYEFGYLTGMQMTERVFFTLNTMQRLERFRGHFYNWYDTLTLGPLMPKYISTVDSGNLAGHLITLKEALLSLQEKPLVNPNIFHGFRDTLETYRYEPDSSDISKTDSLLKKIRKKISNPPQTLSGYRDKLLTIEKEINLCFEPEGPAASNSWIEKLKAAVSNSLGELLSFAPWLNEAPVPEKFVDLKILDTHISFNEMLQLMDKVVPVINNYLSAEITKNEREWLQSVKSHVVSANRKVKEQESVLHSIVTQVASFATKDYNFLFNRSKGLLHIGYNVDEYKLDPGFYDLLASEVRLGVYVAISQGKLPQKAWFTLGRMLAGDKKNQVLLSWGGSMFEYLMPQLVMPLYSNTLLDQTSRGAVQKQINYGKLKDIPWGISESGYNMMDVNLNYQYRAFGVPGLGLKRGLIEDLVVTPYASMLALMVMPEEATANLKRMAKKGFEGLYGFYEAIDYTQSRVPRGKDYAIVHSYMAHHQGMSFLALGYLLKDRPMQKYFESNPQFQSSLLMLQERISKSFSYYEKDEAISVVRTKTYEPVVRILRDPHLLLPEIQILSNGKYNAVITNTGDGYSRWGDIAINRWREDNIASNKGLFCYIKDTESGSFWSNTYQPTLKPTNSYQAVFSQGHAEFQRFDYGIETKTEVVVSPEHDSELRRVRVINRSGQTRVLEVTSYTEVVIAPQAADEAHPAFSNLFVQTKIESEKSGIVFTRRPRAKDETPPWAFHQMTVRAREIVESSYETDRMLFIGKNNSVVNPDAVVDGGKLSGSEGSVLDPVAAVRHKVVLKHNEYAVFDLVLGITESEESCRALLNLLQDTHLRNRAFELSWTHSQVLLRQINATEAEAQLFNKLAGSVIFTNAAFRAPAGIISSNVKGQQDLWGYSISGDLPIVLLKIYNIENIDLVQQLIKAHTYWGLNGLPVDLIIWNEDFGSYRQVFYDQISDMINAAAGSNVDNKGKVYVRSSDQISSEDKILFHTVARVVLRDTDGTLADQISKIRKPEILPLPKKSTQVTAKSSSGRNLRLPEGLLFNNRTGGFSEDGKEYITITGKSNRAPLPWVNVIANNQLGTVITASGSAYTWSDNAFEFRITPWHNDPVTESGGEAFYIRDEATGRFWSPMATAAGGNGNYITHHGFGYSIFKHIQDDIESKVTVFVEKEDPVKFAVIKLTNRDNVERLLSVTGYVEWVLGDLAVKNRMHVITQKDREQNTIYARNRYNTIFSNKVCFLDIDSPGTNFSFTADRSEFIGRNGTLQNPASMHRKNLSGKVGAGLNPCAAIQTALHLQPGDELEIVFKLGAGNTMEKAKKMVMHYKGMKIKKSLEKVKKHWESLLGAVKINTPDQSLNVLANGWLQYQTIASRIFGRSGFYQSGGAYGFRDQLQDVMALLHNSPEMAEEQIIRAASRQFKEGDVQHWWHPPTGRGVRTKCSDDYLWLPFVTAKYIEVTGNSEILDKKVAFIEGRLLHQHEDSYYDQPRFLNEWESVYSHCVYAIRYGLKFGEHGLPLIGAGDWNDGMDKVGELGKGESVWLGFFLYSVLTQFAEIARSGNDLEFASECEENAKRLKKNIDINGWDGEWYRRAYFDDGTPLGTSTNDECKIDSISQSWSVLSGAGSPERSKQAMQSLEKHLINKDKRLILLLTPPFDKSEMNPGYIKGYVPGVRENGGQYTHAAIWTLMAFAALGKNEKVWELFSLINPINHALTPEAVSIYKAEPYVLAADVYGAEPHTGRGGWTWYTGSASWLYQFIVEYLLGLKRKADTITIKPCIPNNWPSFEIVYKYKSSNYHISVNKNSHKKGIRINGEFQETDSFTLADDGKEHQVEVFV